MKGAAVDVPPGGATGGMRVDPTKAFGDRARAHLPLYKKGWDRSQDSFLRRAGTLTKRHWRCVPSPATYLKGAHSKLKTNIAILKGNFGE
jgi:hypothetical protein